MPLRQRGLSGTTGASGSEESQTVTGLAEVLTVCALRSSEAIELLLVAEVVAPANVPAELHVPSESQQPKRRGDGQPDEN